MLKFCEKYHITYDPIQLRIRMIDFLYRKIIRFRNDRDKTTIQNIFKHFCMMHLYFLVRR